MLIDVGCQLNLIWRALLRRMAGRVALSFFTMACVSLLVGALVPTVVGLAISFSAWHKAGRLDASVHQADKRAQHVCFHGCVCGRICSLERRSQYLQVG